MATNILLGIGGTGAKIVESVLMLLSAGVGPSEPVIIGLIDQDNSNGNMVRTETLLGLLGRLRRRLATGSNRIDWLHESESTALFSIEAQPLFADEGKAHWRPADEKLEDLRTILQVDRMAADERDLLDMLFRPVGAAEQDREQDLNLAEGYRGRAHVGAAALLSALHHDSPDFLKRVTELLKTSTTNDVRVMLVGSLFGGTGAAGFPTIARSLNNLRAAKNADNIKSDAVKIGGVLMLPYFGFREPNDTSANVIKTAELLPQARIAIDYYDKLLKQEGVFDDLYIAGWDEVTTLNYHEPGRGEQRNPALLPELIAAMGVLDFFTSPMNEQRQQPLLAARAQASAVRWADLPGRSALRDSLFTRMAQALRFSVLWRNMVEPGVDDRAVALPFGAAQIRSPWIRRLAAGTDWQGETAELRKDLEIYTSQLLKWAAALRLYSGIAQFGLWDPGSLLSREQKERPADPVDLHSTRSGEETRSDIARIIVPSDPKETPVGSEKVFDDLSKAKGRGQSDGLGRLIAAVHHASHPFRTEGL